VTDLAIIFTISLIVFDVLSLEVAMSNLDMPVQVVLFLVGFVALVTLMATNNLLLL